MDFDVRNEKGMAALHSAISVRQADLVKFLLEQGADTDVQDDIGRTPLMFACAHNDNRLVCCLTWLHADTTAMTCETQCMKCHHRFQSEEHLEIHKLLSENGWCCEPDDNEIGYYGETALHYCLHYSNMSTTHMVLRENYSQLIQCLDRVFKDMLLNWDQFFQSAADYSANPLPSASELKEHSVGKYFNLFEAHRTSLEDTEIDECCLELVERFRRMHEKALAHHIERLREESERRKTLLLPKAGSIYSQRSYWELERHSDEEDDEDDEDDGLNYYHHNLDKPIRYSDDDDDDMTSRQCGICLANQRISDTEYCGTCGFILNDTCPECYKEGHNDSELHCWNCYAPLWKVQDDGVAEPA